MDEALRIGQVAARVGLMPKTIRYYEEIGLIPPPKRSQAGHASKGYRLFTPADVQRLEFIKRLRLLNLSIGQIGDLLRSVEEGCCGSARPRFRAVVEQKLSEVEDRLRELRELRKTLQHLSERVPSKTLPSSCLPGASVSSCAAGEDRAEAIPLTQITRRGG